MVNEEEIQKNHDILHTLLEDISDGVAKFKKVSNDPDMQLAYEINAIEQITTTHKTLGYVPELPCGEKIKDALLNTEADYFAQGIEFKKP